MGVDFSSLIYDHCFDFWGRAITVTAVTSRNGMTYSARGIYTTRGTLIQTDSGMAVISDQETIIDVRERDPEFGGTPPAQGDIIEILQDGSVTEGVGLYEVTDASSNGGGERTLVIRKLESPTLMPPP